MKDTVRLASIRTLIGPFVVRCTLGSVQPGAASYCVDLECEPEAHEDLENNRSHPDWAVDV